MTYKEQDYEAVILQKLEAMEDFLKSLMSDFERPFEKKGRIVPVEAPATGKVLKWFGGNRLVREGEPLCKFEYSRIPFTKPITAPAAGFLRIEVGEWIEVSIGDTLAKIDTGYRI
jgi:hypothetical protein